MSIACRVYIPECSGEPRPVAKFGSRRTYEKTWDPISVSQVSKWAKTSLEVKAGSMIRTGLLLIALIGIASPVFAAKQVTVAEFKQAIKDIHGKTDADEAWQIANLQLSERLSTEGLRALESTLAGDLSKQALTSVVDESAFLDPPATELPSKPTPDFAEQRRIMGLVVAYVGKAIPLLPNFFATRDTTRYEDTPQLQMPGAYIPYQPMHLVDRSQVTVLYRDGREVVDTGANHGKKPVPAAPGLTTWGVFGPILSIVLLDAAQSKLLWSHWEQGPSGLVAVFRYAVPREKSHYEVNYCCIAYETATMVANLAPFRQLAGYHGEIFVDPATGSIVRLTAEAELKITDPVVEAKILVDYGQVEIGGKPYICPVRSVSSTRAETLQFDPVYKFPLARQQQPLKNAVSEVSFEHYHMFRADSRVLTEEEARLANISPTSSAAAASLASPDRELPVPAATSAQADAQASAAVACPPAAAAAASETPIPPPEPAIPEIRVDESARLPDVANDRDASRVLGGITLRTTSRLVDVALVAFDKHGKPVIDLKPGDLEVYDNGHRQDIRLFNSGGAEPASAATGTPAATSSDSAEPVFTNRAATANASTRPPENSTILMMDASNVAFADLTYARAEMLRFLKTLAADEPVGLYILKSYGFQILAEPTLDHNRIEATLKSWMPSAQDLARAQDEEQRNRQHFDWVHSVSDMTQLNGNGNTVADTLISANSPSVLPIPSDPSLRSMGSNPGRDALSLILGVSRHLAAIPGHKTLVWVASDNVLADWTTQGAPKQEQGNQFIDSFALQAQETLNESHVSIYPLDASQLEAGGIGADLRERNPVPVGLTSRSQQLAGLGDADPGMKPGRITAQMQQDLHPIAGIYRDLAEATGGRALRRAGDIAGELDNVVADGRAAYLLSFTPEGPADDKYHAITVKLSARRALSLRYRTGYFYAKEPTALKDRFRQSVWDPRDVNEIGIAASPAVDAKGVLLKLNIDATQLGLAQNAGRWTDQLGVFLALRDDSGLHAKVTGRSLMLRLLPGTYPKILKDGIPFEQPIDTKSSFDSARLIVVDENSGRMGSVTIPLSALKPGS